MGIDSLLTDAIGLAKENPILTAVGTAGAVGGAVLGTSAIVGTIKRRKAKRRKVRSVRSRTHRNKYKKTKRKYKKKHSKRTSHKRIRYTKRGQPYVIMGNGRARFISKRGAKASRRRKGGRY